jgi:glucosamine--fructose-6-phosphate aminotransferase (isomerizing)
MNPLLKEIDEIPATAREFLKSSSDFSLPLDVPYIGMGSSYFAPLAFKYMGIDIHPEIASEYYNYVFEKEKHDIAVILSQSGESSECLWCRELFGNYIAITNNRNSSLAAHPNAKRTVLLHAGEEKYSSTKTYINTLLALFKGFGFNSAKAVELLNEKIQHYRQLGEKMADDIFRKVTKERIHGIYLTGSGPNIATAYEASLILSENTKLCFTGLPMAQYDHGPKETSAGSIVIQILAQGKSRDRSLILGDKISKAGAYVITVEETDIDENFSIIHNMVPLNYLAVYLAKKLGVTETFAVGGKITTVS